MATIGQALTAPEIGWKRYDDADINVSYTSGWTVAVDSNCYNGNCHQVSSMSAGTVESASFNFVGTKIRFISYICPSYVEKCYISIDGTEYGFITNGPTVPQALVFEIAGLALKEHSVQIYEKDVCSPRLGLVFDAIDIDDIGELKPHSPTNLTATAGDAQVTLNWDAVTGANAYNVKRSTIAGGPYTTIASNVTNTTYVDNTVTNGITYYYVVAAIDGNSNESANSNEASATPQDSGKALLVVNMGDGRREYELFQADVNAFINWYDAKTGGTGLNYYTFNKSFNIGPFINRKDDLVFDEIINFEVMAYKIQ